MWVQFYFVMVVYFYIDPLSSLKMGNKNSSPAPEPEKHQVPSPSASSNLRGLGGFEGCPVFVAKYDYERRAEEDLGFKRGDLLCVLDSTEDKNWWLACSKKGGKKGYIPSNHVVEWKDLEFEAEE